MLSRLAIAALALLVFQPAAQAQTFSLRPQHGTLEHGTATLTQMGPDVQVTINVRELPHPAAPQFAHFHQGTCTQLGAPMRYELNPIRKGRSSTTLKNVSLAALGTAYSIAIHQTLAHVSMHVACGGPASK